MIAVLAASAANAGVLSWDTNGSASGSGNAGGTWGSAWWSTDSAGGYPTAVWTSASDAYFSAGSDGVGPFNVFVTQGITVDNLTVGLGSVTLTNSGGSIALGAASTWGAAGGASLTVNPAINNNGFAWTLTSTGSTTIGGVISGGGGLVTNGPGTLTVTASNTYTGTTTLGGSGTLVLTGSLGTGNLAFSSGSPTLKFGTGNTRGAIAARIKNSAGLITLDTNGQAITLGAIDNTNTGGVKLLVGTNAITLAAANTFSGGLTVSGSGAGGSFIVPGADAALGAPGGALTLDNVTLKVSTASFAIGSTRTITLTSNGAWFSAGNTKDLTVDAKITGTGWLGLNYDGNGNYYLSNANNDYQGDTRIGTAGPNWSGAYNATLLATADNVIPYGSGKGDVVIGYQVPNATKLAILNLFGHNLQINGLSTAGLSSTSSTFAIVDNTYNANSTLTVGNNNATSTFGGVIRNSSTWGISLGLTKVAPAL